MPKLPACWIATIYLAAAACGGGGQGDAVLDDRLEGEWQLVLTPVQAAFAKEGGLEAETRGTIAFVPNLARNRVAGFNAIPQQVGTHNLRLSELAPELGPRAEPPTAAGSSVRDSVRIVIDPGTGEPLVLRGRWQGSGVVGEWTAHHRAGIDQGGRFTLQRPPP